MHITSDHYRGRERRTFEEIGLAWHPVACELAADCSQSEPVIKPLRPSCRTLRDLALRYKKQGTVRHHA